MTNITKLTPTSSTFEINHHAYTIQIGGMYNIYNALAAYALGSFLGVTPDQIGKAFESDKKKCLAVRKWFKSKINKLP